MQRKFTWTKQHDGSAGMGGQGDDTFTFDVPSGYEFRYCKASVVAGSQSPGVRVTKRPSAGDRRSDREIQVHWWFDGGGKPFIKYRVSAICNEAPLSIQKGNRALVIVSELTAVGSQNWQWLYQWLESMGPSTVRGILDDDYRTLSVLTGYDATRQKFIDHLRTIGSDSHNKAIDVVLMLHGLKNELYFQDGGINTDMLRADIQTLGLEDRLRACFSTACFGATHALDLVTAGFRVVCGARGSYANGAYGVPVALSSWAAGDTFRVATSKANNPTIVGVSDRLAQAAGFQEVDSHWVVVGNALTRITTTLM
jgi:hypothetical protein